MNMDLAKRPFVLQMDVLSASVINGNLILALKHPANNGESSKIARQIVVDLTTVLYKAGWFEGIDLEELRTDYREAGIDFDAIGL